MTTMSKIAEGLTVVDLGMGMAAALVAKHFAEAGATVVRIEPESGDPFDTVYPAHSLWRAGSRKADITELDALLVRADLCLVGGEEYPGLAWSFDAVELAERNPCMVVTNIKAGVTADTSDLRAVDLLVQARTGLVWEQFHERPICFAMSLPTYGAAMLAMIGSWSALLERLDSGSGQLVETSMQQGVAGFWAPLWMDAERPDAEFRKASPKGVPHLIFQCADGDWIQFVMAVKGSVANLYAVLGIDAYVDPNDRGNPKPGAPLDQYFGNLPLIAPFVRKRERAELLQAAWAVGLAAEPILEPGEAWSDRQVIHNNILQAHPSGATGVGASVRVRTIEHGVDRAPLASARPEGDARPLAGTRVLDFGSFVAGPYSSKILADLGADVIKVEVLAGSAGRGIVRHTIAVESGKRSVAIDMKAPEGAEIVRRLCAAADLTHHNFRVGVAARLGVDPESVRKLKCDAATVETSAYGASGPKAGNSGFDMVVQALCGHFARAGGDSNPPLWVRAPLVDYATGMLGACAMLMALFAQRSTGRAVEAEVNLLDTGLFLMSELMQTANGKFVGAARLNRDQTGFHPAECLYQTREGWIAVAARDDAMAGRLARTLGIELPPQRASWAEPERVAIARAVRELDCAALLAIFKQADVWAEHCVEDGLKALFDSSDARASGILVDRHDAHYGRIKGVLGPLMRFSRSDIPVGRLKSAPGVGEHTRVVLEELGYSAIQIDDLLQRRIVA